MRYARNFESCMLPVYQKRGRGSIRSWPSTCRIHINFAAVLPISGNATAQANVGYWGQTGKHLLSLSFTGFDAVDGAHSAASRCHKVVASNRTTLRGAVHGRG